MGGSSIHPAASDDESDGPSTPRSKGGSSSRSKRAGGGGGGGGGGSGGASAEVSVSQHVLAQQAMRAKDVVRLTDLLTGARNPYTLEARVADFEDTFYAVRRKEVALKAKVEELAEKIGRVFMAMKIADSVISNQGTAGGFGFEHLDDAQIMAGLEKGKQRIRRHKARGRMPRPQTAPSGAQRDKWEQSMGRRYE